MENKQLKKELAKMAKRLDKEWRAEVDNNDRKKPMDYIRSSHLSGQLDMVVRILAMLS